jgi:hypothetical protein
LTCRFPKQLLRSLSHHHAAFASLFSRKGSGRRLGVPDLPKDEFKPPGPPKAPGPPKDEVKPFTYQPLDLASDEIRLVRLQPDRTTNELVFDILNVAIERAPPFKALSYAWGKSSERTSVRFNNGVFKVNNTLYNFLVQVTEKSEDAQAYYWIDAISIDQGNVAERNQQVLRMKEIYEAAAQIVVWLGSPRIPMPLTNQPTASTSKLMEPGLRAPRDLLINPNLGWRGSRRPRGMKYGLPARLLAKRTALTRMYEDTWWERAWIIQEASTPAIKDTSQPNSVWIGPHRFNFDDCLRGSETYGKAAASEYQRYRVPTMVEDLAWIRARRSDVASKLEIYDLLPRVRRYEAHDMRDKIYSILAISCDYDAKDLKPDYGKPTPEIYTGLVRYLIERDQKLDILAYCTEKRNIEGLPSWVPGEQPQNSRGTDFRAILLPTAAESSDVVQRNIADCFSRPQDWSYKNVPVPFLRRSYNACGELPWRVSFQNWGSSIRCKGVHIASIHDVGPARNKAPKYGINESAVSQRWFTFGMLSLSHNAYDCTYEERLDTLRRVMCADVFEGDSSQIRRNVVRWPSTDTSHRFEFSERDFVVNPNMDKATNLRRLISLDDDLLGLGPADASAGDFVYVLCGLPVPLVLRKFQEHFLIVGECYVHGIMDAERPWEQDEIRDIDIW